MPLYYLDSSALVKHSVPEVGSPWVASLIASQPIAMSVIAYAEIASALARRVRERSLSIEQIDSLFDAFVAEARAFVVYDAATDVVNDAALMMIEQPEQIALRAIDALHLVSARRVFDASASGVRGGVVVSVDHRLLVAAQWAGLAVDNPEDHV